jgi:hypothetical protein
LDGDLSAAIQPLFGVKQGSPLSPLLFSINLNSVLFAGDLSRPSNEHAGLQTMLNKLRVYTEKKFITVNTQKSEVMCFNSKGKPAPSVL